jgi:hypothetical protein
MTETVIFFAALLMLTCAILAALYRMVRDAPPPQPERQSYRRHRPWNFK